MKRFVITVLALVLLGVFSFFNQRVYRRSTEALRQQLAIGVSLVEAGEREQAVAAMERLNQMVERCLLYFNVTTNHSEIDLMRESLTLCQAALLEGDLLSCLTKAKLLDAQLSHIYETERISWENVL